MNVWAVVIQVVVGIIIVAPALWISGRLLVGRERAKFTDALWIVVLGVVTGAIISYFVGGILASIIMLIIWLALIKHFFDCGWLKAIVIAIVAAIIFVIIAAVLALLGLGLFGAWL
jgi:chromate transport protein ChrA